VKEQGDSPAINVGPKNSVGQGKIEGGRFLPNPPVRKSSDTQFSLRGRHFGQVRLFIHSSRLFSRCQMIERAMCQTMIPA
jgi:hypothetical protein